MALYLISYDVRTKNHDYESLTSRLKSLNAVKILFSEWLLPSIQIGFAKTIFDDLKDRLFPSDSLLVQEVTKDSQFGNLEISREEFERLLLNARF